MNSNDLDAALKLLLAEGERHAAATLLVRTLGPDVLRLLHARFRDAELASELFARVSEALWVALPDFAFRSTARVFVFTITRNVGNRYLARELPRARRGVPLSLVDPLHAELQRIRTETAAHLRTENKTRVAELRAQLDEEEQLVLTLRVDRQLEFREIAQVVIADLDASPGAIEREAARLRKRFQLVKRKLKRWLAATE